MFLSFAAIAFNLAEIELVQAQTGEYPILMFDEVLAELDALRAQALFSLVPKLRLGTSLGSTGEASVADTCA